MEDLWEFPYFEDYLPESIGGVKLPYLQSLPQVKHGFTRYHVTLYPYKTYMDKIFLVEGHEWVALEQVPNLPFSSGHRKLLGHL